MTPLPKITCVCCTFGRARLLNEAVAYFLQQDYEGEKELIVLNSYKKQTLVGEFPNVKIINLPLRPPSLGAKRNLAVKASSGDWIVTYDDDDIYAPNFLSEFEKHIKPGIDWVWLDKQFFSEKFKIKEIMVGSFNSVAFSRKAFDAIGGYGELTVGEDRQFVGKLTSQFQGVKVKIATEDIAFIYSWGNNTFKTSGHGFDTNGKISAHARVEKEVDALVRTGKEPHGVVKLKPELQHDPRAMIAEFLGTNNTISDRRNNGVCVVELGRYGDIVNILPILQIIHDNYAKPYLMISREFAHILDGVSYVEPYVVDLDNSQINEAMNIARREFKFVIQTQIWGKNYVQEKKCRSYNEESWRMAGMLHRFNDDSLRPLFDRRDPERELALFNKLSTGDKPMLLVNTTSSVSSPFPGGKKLFEEITKALSAEFQIVDLSTIKATAIYDLIGLFDRAAAIICIDSAVLHLQAASDCPVVAIVNPNPWSGSILRANYGVRIPYSNAEAFPANVTGNVKPIISGKFSKERSFPTIRQPSPAPERRLFHCVERHEDKNSAELHRKEACWRSWDVLYSEKGVIPCHLWEQNYPRDARDIGESRALPYFKDVLAFGMEQANDSDILFWTNDDNWLHPELADYLKLHVSIYGVCVSRRCEFRNRTMPRASESPEAFQKASQHHIGRDLFAATKAWLEANWEDVPDCILGAALFDFHLAALARRDKQFRCTKESLFNEHCFPAEIPVGYVSHTFHTPVWTRTNRITPAHRHNSNLLMAFAKQHFPELKFTPEGNI